MPASAAHAKRDPERLDELVQAAARLFRDRGYDATSMQDIAAEFGTLKSSLYHYVTTKEDLLWMIVEKPFTDLVDGAAAIFADRSVPMIERMRRAITAHCESFEQHYPHMIVCTRENGETLSPERRAQLMALRDRYYGLWKQAFTTGKRSGEIRSEVDVGIATQAVLGMINWMFRWFRPGGGMRPSMIAEQFGAILASGVST